MKTFEGEARTAWNTAIANFMKTGRSAGYEIFSMNPCIHISPKGGEPVAPHELNAWLAVAPIRMKFVVEACTTRGHDRKCTRLQFSP